MSVKRLHEQDAKDYVAYYMGVPTEPYKTAAGAHEPLLVNEFGRMLARNIVTGLEKTAPAYASKQYMDDMTRLLNRD